MPLFAMGHIINCKAATLYCGSRLGETEAFQIAARDMANALVARNINLIYGGASIGLMGVLADSALAAGGHVTGIITHDLIAREIGHKHLSARFVVDTMAMRKTRLAEMGDVLIALPGGVGTLDEIYEQWSNACLGLHTKPIGFLNIADYYTPLQDFTAHMQKAGFMDAWQVNKPVFADSVEGLLSVLLEE